MAENAVLTDTGYEKLLKDLRKLIQEGRKRAVKAASKELLKMYWELGRRITKENMTGNANYGDSILTDLAEDLGIDYGSLSRAVLFFELYPNFSPGGNNLTWSHYKVLLTIADKKERDWFEAAAQKEGWNRDELAQALGSNAYQNRRQLTDQRKKAKFRLKRPQNANFTYKAEVKRVVDTDTQLLHIDLGFETWRDQRIRLAGIDAPPLDTPKGYEGFEYVRDQLAKVPFVVIKSNRIDIHGRYVADLFYSFHETDRLKIFQNGRWLNQELLDLGYAKPL